MAAEAPGTKIINVSLPNTSKESRWDVTLQSDGRISSINSHDPHGTWQEGKDSKGALLAPSLCHPHLHIDKAYLLSHPKYSHLRIEKGDFQEAMDLTSQAKGMFEDNDLLERGSRVLDESIAAGVTHIRAFVELDIIVGNKCLEAGIKLKQQYADRIYIQLCAFAQLPLFTTVAGDENGEAIRSLMETVARRDEIEVMGSTPYVEEDGPDGERAKKNVEWMIRLARETKKHLDFHLDYHLDVEKRNLVRHVIATLKTYDWNRSNPGKTVVLGHCTRLALFTPEDWKAVRDEIGDLPISFVGLPTSDLFMMPPTSTTDHKVITRGTLPIPALIQNYNLNACLGINNIGNAFTPHGSCDPLTLACNGVGIYQAGTEADAECLYGCVSWRARKAIGVADKDERQDCELKEGDRADVVLFADGVGDEKLEWRVRKNLAEVVWLYDSAKGRRRWFGGVESGQD